MGHGVSAVLSSFLDARLPAFVADQPIEAVGLHAQQVGHRWVPLMEPKFTRSDALCRSISCWSARAMMVVVFVVDSVAKWTFLIAR